MKSYIFALKRQNYDIHGTVFNLLKAYNIKDFTPNNPNKKPITFYDNGDYIVCRTNAMVSNIPMQVEEVNFNEGDELEMHVNLPRVYPKSILNKQQIDEFIKEKNRKPKHSEAFQYKILSDDEVVSYATDVLQRAGLEAKDLKVFDGRFYLVTGRNKALKSAEIRFRAKVIDVKALENAWFVGVGRNKTYGFGTLRVIPS